MLLFRCRFINWQDCINGCMTDRPTDNLASGGTNSTSIPCGKGEKKRDERKRKKNIEMKWITKSLSPTAKWKAGESVLNGTED